MEIQKRNLLKMLVDQRRIKELDRLIPLEYKKIEGIREIDVDYQAIKNRLDEYLLEYQERAGREYKVFVGTVNVEVLSDTILDSHSHGVLLLILHDINDYKKMER